MCHANCQLFDRVLGDGNMATMLMADGKEHKTNGAAHMAKIRLKHNVYV